jgi:hypothetical protein
MNHKDLREFIREELSRGEVTEAFGWLKRAWRNLVDTEWKIMRDAFELRGGEYYPISLSDWNSAPSRTRNQILDVAHDYLNNPGDAESERDFYTLVKKKFSWARPSRSLKREPSRSRSNSGGRSGYGGGGGGGYGYDPYGYGYYGGGYGKSFKDDNEKDNKKDDVDPNDEGFSGFPLY